MSCQICGDKGEVCTPPFNLCITTYTSFTRTVIWTVGRSRTPVDITGCSIRLQFRMTQDSLILYESNTTNGDIVITAPLLGTFTINTPAAKTALLPAPAQVEYWCIVIFPDGRIIDLFKGYATVSPGMRLI